MKWLNIGNELDNFNKNWKNIKNIAVFGFGEKAQNFIEQIKNEVEIKLILDNDESKCGKSFQNIKIFHPSELNSLKDQKILISSSSSYPDISEQLIQLGLVDNVDFWDMEKFISAYFWYKYKQVYLTKVHIALTTKCSLNCKNCNMYIPYFKNKAENIPLEDIRQNIDKFFSFVNKVYNLVLLGGEPFFHPKFDLIIEYLTKNYAKNISKLSITTNGTIIPPEKTLINLSENKIFITISNYSKTLNYDPKVQKLIQKLQEYNINFVENRPESWLDFGFPHNPANIPDEKIETHMHKCSPIFKGFNDNKFYYCHLVWSAVKAGLLKETQADYLNLEELNPNSDYDKIKLIEYNLGFMENGYLSLCKICKGCSKDNKDFVLPAIQKN